MEFLFLGTCGGRFDPRLETDLANTFDCDARRSPGALLDGHILIDCGPHCLEALRIAGVKESEITDVVITHLHWDHYTPEHLAHIAQNKTDPLTVWVAEESVLPPMENVIVKPMRSLQPYEVRGGYTVTGLPSNHAPETNPRFLLFEKEGKKILYATDGAWFMLETYYHLQNAALDLLVLDATCGDYEGDFRIAEHNSIPMIRLMLPSLKTWGMITDNTEVYLTHLAPQLHRSHAETVEIVKQDGVKVAYDGLLLNF